MHPVISTVIANHFRRTGRDDKAAEILIGSIGKQAISSTAAATLASIFYEARSWSQASALWRLLASADAQNLEANIRLAHCLCELDDSSAFIEQVDRVVALLNCKGSSLGCSLDDLLKLVYEQICVYWVSGDLARAERLIHGFALPSTYLRRVLGTESGSTLTDEVILRKLDEARHLWERGDKTVPYLVNRAAKSYSGHIEGKHLLLVQRQHFLSKPDSREHEFVTYFRDSARMAGLRTTVYFAESFLNPTSVSPIEQYRRFLELAALIEAERPDAVVFDDLCAQDVSGNYISRDTYQRTFSMLKRTCGFQLIAYYCDPWTPEAIAGIKSASAFADVVWHQNPRLAKHSDSARVVLAPFPYPPTLRVAHTDKTIGTAFAGGVFEYNSPRAVWLTLLARSKAPCQILTSAHTQTSTVAGSSPAEHAEFLSRVSATLNFSRRVTGEHIITGRIWEAINAKSLLLNEEDDAISYYLAPWVHYIPFSNLPDLLRLIDFFARHEDLRTAIAREALSWFDEHYSAQAIWSEVLKGRVISAGSLESNAAQ